MLKLNIKSLVDQKFENINQFAKSIGVGHNSAQSLYDGTVTRIEFSTLESICDIFDCTPNDVLFYKKNTKHTLRIHELTNESEILPDQIYEAIRKIVKEELNDTNK